MSTPKVEVYLITYNEERILPYTLRHYSTFASRMVVYDSFSTDHTKKIAWTYGAEVVNWDTGNEFNDQINRDLKSTVWEGTKADWVIVADADELIYFPKGACASLESYERQNVEVVQPWGWEMYSEVFPTTSGQIYDEVKEGARDDKWYSKPILFSPKRVKKLAYAAGAHQVLVTNQRGRTYLINNNQHDFTQPPSYLFHCKHLGPESDIAAGYNLRRTRLSEINVRMGWGNFESGEKHASDKRAMIKANLQKISL